ncbi:Os08g0406900 [Oryza sativa Japonica Group]|uniref:Os08g0406900 protein n=2 Tax=Oryza sativa subsp. japonica TaxID=39947 RepID=Q0J5S8_ORYSJ|nr:hypothetical protein EE612_044213 [Oryza sativa]BAF23687.1 Os08g0406900 [Oryza sativa Japonica Group]BAT05373.1 Os08g0406900 [Oryza sativa Japonica Group]|eukprot:NP_001061773.1 Os08g0406900 [Oryza sativa Japonica Group]
MTADGWRRHRDEAAHGCSGLQLLDNLHVAVHRQAVVDQVLRLHGFYLHKFLVPPCFAAKCEVVKLAPRARGSAIDAESEPCGNFLYHSASQLEEHGHVSFFFLCAASRVESDRPAVSTDLE